MKVTLDLDALLNKGKITQKEYEKFSELSSKTTTSLGFSVLIAFGIVAIIAGLLILEPSAEVATGAGLLILISGIGFLRSESNQWRLLANIFVVLGALLFGGGILTLSEGEPSTLVILFVVVTYALAGVLARSSFLVVLSVFLSSSLVGAMTGYSFASYYLSIENPITTVMLYAVLGIGLHQVSKNVDIKYESIALAGAKASVFLVNFGFWVGSLYGSREIIHEEGKKSWEYEMVTHISPEVFSILWAVAIISAGVWAVKNNRRWTLNVVATFGGIHFYTQWFVYFGAEPITLIFLGILTLGCVFSLKLVNSKMQKTVGSH